MQTTILKQPRLKGNAVALAHTRFKSNLDAFFKAALEESKAMHVKPKSLSNFE